MDNNTKSIKNKQYPKLTIYQQKKQSYYFPNIKPLTFSQQKINRQSSFNHQIQRSYSIDRSYSNHKFNKTNTKQSMHTRIYDKIRNKQKQNLYKIQKSILRFTQMQNSYQKTLLQRKKQKKYFNAEKLQKQEEKDFFNSLHREKLMKQQFIQEDFNHKQYHLETLQNVCYDSQFIYQRQGSCLTLLNNRLYLFGGAIRRKFHYYSQNDNTKENIDVLLHSYEQNRWARQPISNKVSIDKKNLIHHTVNSIGKKYIVIAGGMMGDSQKTLSKFNQTILIYNVQNKRMEEIPWNVRLRSHSTITFQNNVIVYGGISQQGKIKNQLYLVSLVLNGQAVGIRYSRFQTNQCLAYHQMVTTLDQDKNFKIYMRQNNGVYVFGGEDQEGKLNNSLRILRIYSLGDLQKKSRKNFQIIKTAGQSPCPRKNHSMNLIPNKNWIVIIGGLDQFTNSLSDIWIYDLFQPKWCRIQTQPTIDVFFGGLCKHGTVSTTNSIYIMGGKYSRDIGSQNLLKLNFEYQNNIKKTKQRKVSEMTKLSSCWTINASNNNFGTLDHIILNDNDY